MSERRLVPMDCAYCGERCEWPDDFPSPHYAMCFDCWETENDKRWSVRLRAWLSRIFGVTPG